MTDPTPPHRRSPLEHERDDDLAVARRTPPMSDMRELADDMARMANRRD